MVVLSVDVGLRTCGYVIAGVKNLEVSLITDGQIKPNPRQTLPQRLSQIFEELKKAAIEHKPEAILVERLYSHYRHPTTLGALAQVRGVIALLAHQEKMAFFEYSPTRARKSFLGHGHVKSGQVKKMAENVTGKKFKSPHTADAFSLAVAFSHDQKLARILKYSR